MLVPSSFSYKLSLSFFLSMDRVTPHMYHVIPVPLLLLGHHPCPPPSLTFPGEVIAGQIAEDGHIN